MTLARSSILLGHFCVAASLSAPPVVSPAAPVHGQGCQQAQPPLWDPESGDYASAWAQQHQSEMASSLAVNLAVAEAQSYLVAGVTCCESEVVDPMPELDTHQEQRQCQVY
mmetsp:Transcript_65792/g.157220  ORF Transcript_65792/g.157220 Transcript_65792/m.157220 type:complete len:111 (+) Transcript_65792:2248-2580(+)